MENLGETHEATKIDIQQLKEQIHEILEAIDALENSEETSTQQHQQRVQETQVFPPYGLPSNYTPPIGFDSEKKAASYMALAELG